MPDLPHGVSALHQTVAQQVSQRLSVQPQVVSVLVFGSVATGHVDEQSDVDMLVVCKPQVMPVTTRRTTLYTLDATWAFDIPMDNPLFAALDEGIADNIPVSIHYQTTAWIEAVLHDVLEHGALQTDLLPFRAYTLPALLQRAWLLYDQHGTVEQWRQQIEPYPPMLKQNIIRHFMPMLHEQTDELVRSAQRQLGPMVFIFHLSRAVDALRSVLYAVNDTYDPADRRAEQLVLPTLTVVPDKFSQRLRHILEGPFTPDGALQAALAFRQVVQEVDLPAESYLEQ